MTITAASWSACLSILARKSSRSTEPSAAAFTTTTRSPASAAEAALVPCADEGIRQIVRSGWPCAWW